MVYIMSSRSRCLFWIARPGRKGRDKVAQGNALGLS